MEPKAGEILVVNGAAGAVGSTVGQLAKLKVSYFYSTQLLTKSVL